MNSALYVGYTRHRRFSPHAHAFRYPMFMVYLDLTELEQVFAGRWLWSTKARNLAEYRRSDYFGEPSLSLSDAVRARVEAESGHRPLGPIRVLSHLRYFGYSFNPVVFYYCFAPDGITLEAILAEITNTPWRERHAYVLSIDSSELHGNCWHWKFDKRFHVSPFLPMGLHYDWRFQAPAEHLRVHMDVHNEHGKQFDATLTLGRQEITGSNLAKALIRYPAMSLSVLAKIYWQALLIRWKRNPFYDHPKPSQP